MDRLSGLKCRECGRAYPDAPFHVCELCVGPLEVDYRYDVLRSVVTRQSIAAGPPSMWRYRDLLPVASDDAVGPAVGFTPLVPARNLAVAATRKLIERGVIPRDEAVVICITGNGLKTPDALQDRLRPHVNIRPSLSAFDRALANLKAGAQEVC